MLLHLHPADALSCVLEERSLLSVEQQQQWTLPDWTPESNSSSFLAAVAALNASLGQRVLAAIRQDAALRNSLSQIADVCLLQVDLI